MKREQFEEMIKDLRIEVQKMIDMDESRTLIRSYLIKQVTAHGAKDNPNYTARQLSIIFDLATEPRKISTQDKRHEIVKALMSLGYFAVESLSTMDDIDEDRTRVFYNGDQIGIYDFKKHTFID